MLKQKKTLDELSRIESTFIILYFPYNYSIEIDTIFIILNIINDW
jgi:hypothetical protein